MSVKFKANLWNRPQKHEELLNIVSDQNLKVAQEVMANKGKTNSQQHHRSNTLWELEGMYAAKSRLSPTEVKGLFYLLKTFACKNQRSFFIKCIGFWFVGCHCGNFVSVYLVLSFK